MDKTLIAVVGPTAIGKTSLAIALARHYQTEILSADSRQFYKEMTLGTAVPSAEELAEVPHHFIQHLSIFESWSVGDFEREALRLLKILFQTKDVVIAVGGSGLYVQALVEGLDHFPNVDQDIRKKLNQQFSREGISFLQNRLQEIDPVYYQQVDLQNPHRLIRAIEIYESSGQPYSTFLNKPRKERPFKTLYVGLTAERDVLYKRIEDRVDRMMRSGLLEEARTLFKHKDLVALQTVGYRELFEYLEGHASLEEAVAEIKKNTRRFAKRQLTWFRKNEQIFWADIGEAVSVFISHLQLKLKSDKDVEL